MTQDQPSPQVSAETLLETIRAWQAGEAPREAVTLLLAALPADQGETVQATIRELNHWIKAAPTQGQAKSQSQGAAHQDETDAWRSELMACRAKAWSYPQGAGMLVSPAVLILTDGNQGVILQQDHARALPSSTSGSLMLLCQTIVMAQNAVDAKEVGQLRQQRIDSTSTSLSEIEVIQ